MEWTYDAKGRRIGQKSWLWTNSTWIVVEDLKFISDPMSVGRHILELNASNNTVVRSYVWGLDLSGSLQGAGGVGGLLWITLNSGPAAGTHFAVYDGNGNVVGLISASTGTETARYEYGHFAGPIRVSGLAARANPCRFSTKRADDTTDLVLYEYRAYSSSLGRWLTRDPIGENGGVNLYSFVRNDAVRVFDYLGLASRCREAVGKNGKPRITFDPSQPAGGWRGTLGFGEIQGSAQARMVSKIYIKWKAEVAVLCVCASGCEIRRGTRIQKDEELGNWLVYDPTWLPASPFPIPVNIWEAIGTLIGDAILELIGPAPIPVNNEELESMKAAIRALLERRPRKPWDGAWKGGESPCDA